jgi:hypothetical protein
MSIKTFFKSIATPKITMHLDYKNLPPEIKKQISIDALHVCAEIIGEDLPAPERLELLADWLDKTTADNPDKEIQKDLRKWAEGVREIKSLFDETKRADDELRYKTVYAEKPRA